MSVLFRTSSQNPQVWGRLHFCRSHSAAMQDAMNEILGARREPGRKKNTVNLLLLVPMENSPQKLCSTIWVYRSIDERRLWKSQAPVESNHTAYRTGSGLDRRRMAFDSCAFSGKDGGSKLPMSGLRDESRNARASRRARVPKACKTWSPFGAQAVRRRKHECGTGYPCLCGLRELHVAR